MIKACRHVLNSIFRKQIYIPLPNEVMGNWHVNFIVHLASILKPKNYVELGLYQCELFNKVIPFSNNLIGVDMEISAGSYMKKNHKTEFVCSKTQDFAEAAKKNNLRIDMLFIDANHSCSSVLEDFNAFFPLVEDGGIILMHDGYPRDLSQTADGYCGDGFLAIEQLTESQNGFEMMTIPMPPGLTIARKKTKHLPWRE